ncbi:hypothetical protein EJB05_02309 [Eragrostis curvula]|uniref:Uncharacterized protein n=1 Tax=Eragrostis curvula TaxID=38414 RepID=A0A5J9UKU4_9POAL|nr:hypothetical protein EJB05_26427 [Eragrostis curvula]TVU50912.1 hypothetical protein EJB05_02309 [Eragrostis curvula]
MLLIAILFPSTHPSEAAAREEEAEARRRRRCPSGARQGCECLKEQNRLKEQNQAMGFNQRTS